MSIYLNEYDLIDAARRFDVYAPNRARAAVVVARLADWANRTSDGWAYWPKPKRAAARAVDLIHGTTNWERQALLDTDATDAELAAALRPIKAFLTRQGLTAPEKREILGGLA